MEINRRQPVVVPSDMSLQWWKEHCPATRRRARAAELICLINWATSGPGFLWPVSYWLSSNRTRTHWILWGEADIEIYEGYPEEWVTTFRRASGGTCCDSFPKATVPLGWCIRKDWTKIEAAKSLLRASWQDSGAETIFEDILRSGLLGEEDIYEVAHEVWPKANPRAVVPSGEFYGSVMNRDSGKNFGLCRCYSSANGMITQIDLRGGSLIDQDDAAACVLVDEDRAGTEWEIIPQKRSSAGGKWEVRRKGSIAMALTSELFDAYWQTSFQSDVDGRPLVIHPAGLCPDLDEMLKAKDYRSWAFVTAFNPASVPATDEENRRAQGQLHKEIQNNGWQFYPGIGQPGDARWTGEPSFLVLGISRHKAMQLGTKFGQLAVVFGEPDSRAELLLCPSKKIKGRPPLLVRTVYHSGEPSLVVATRDRALHVARIHWAIESSETWGEFKFKMPRHDIEGYWDQWFDDPESTPRDDDSFDAALVPGYCDGDYPDWLQQEMLETFPRLVEMFGKYEDSVLNGPFCHLPATKAVEVFTVLRGLGFQIEQADDLNFY
jgi:hypothetical protein